MDVAQVSLDFAVLGVRHSDTPAHHPHAEQQFPHDIGERKRVENRMHGSHRRSKYKSTAVPSAT